MSPTSTSTSTSTDDSPPQMEYVRLGNTGLKVTRLSLGCMSCNSFKWSPWVKNEEESIEFISLVSTFLILLILTPMVKVKEFS